MAIKTPEEKKAAQAAAKDRQRKLAAVSKRGARVTWMAKNGKPCEGRVVGTRERTNGLFVQVDLSPKGQTPDLRSLRPAVLSLAPAGA